MDLSEIKTAVVAQGNQISEWQKKQDERFALLQQEVDEALKKAARPANPAAGGTQAADQGKLAGALRKAFQGDDTAIKAMSVGSDPDGGYLVVPQMDTVVRQLREQVSPMSGLCREIIVDRGDAAVLPFIRGTLASAWVGETDARPDTDTLPVGENRIPLNEHYTCPAVSQKLLDTASYEVGSIIVEQIAHGLAVSEAAAIVTGNGVGKPRGIATYATAATADSARAWGTIQHIATGASGAWHTTKFDPLFDAIAALQPAYRQNAVWMMSRGTLASLRKLKEASTDRYLLEPSLQAGEPWRLMGFPVVINDTIPAIAADSLSVWLGDFKQAYAVVRQPGIKLLRDPYTAKGQVKFYAYARVGGDLINSEAVKVVKFAAA